jgi:threonine aldolase
MPVRLEQVETNFVQIDAGALGLDADDAVARLRSQDVLLSFAARHGVLRAVTHLDVSADDVEEALERIPRALTGAASTAPLAADAPTPF